MSRARKLHLRTTVIVDAQGIDELTIQKLVDYVSTKLPADLYDSNYEGSEEEGWEIEFYEEVFYKFYPSNSWYDPDEYEYSDFAEEYEYKEFIKEFEQANNLELDFSVSNNFDSMEYVD